VLAGDRTPVCRFRKLESSDVSPPTDADWELEFVPVESCKHEVKVSLNGRLLRRGTLVLDVLPPRCVVQVLQCGLSPDSLAGVSQTTTWGLRPLYCCIDDVIQLQLSVALPRADAGSFALQHSLEWCRGGSLHLSAMSLSGSMHYSVVMDAPAGVYNVCLKSRLMYSSCSSGQQSPIELCVPSLGAQEVVLVDSPSRLFHVFGMLRSDSATAHFRESLCFSLASSAVGCYDDSPACVNWWGRAAGPPPSLGSYVPHVNASPAHPHGVTRVICQLDQEVSLQSVQLAEVLSSAAMPGHFKLFVQSLSLLVVSGTGGPVADDLLRDDASPSCPALPPSVTLEQLRCLLNRRDSSCGWAASSSGWKLCKTAAVSLCVHRSVLAHFLLLHCFSLHALTDCVFTWSLDANRDRHPRTEVRLEAPTLHTSQVASIEWLQGTVTML
jgi:hypothetical protein